MTLFDDSLLRFATSGTLIGLYGLTHALARRREPDLGWPNVRVEPWVKVSIMVSIGAFYLLIDPAGGSLLGGLGNMIGIALALGSMALRFHLRSRTGRVRHPAMAARMLFYVALPAAVGVPLGWVALTLPAFVLSAHCVLREDRILSVLVGQPYQRLMSRSYRWIPGIW